MANVTVEKNKYTVESLYQWDLNRTLKIYGLSLPSVPEIHFTNGIMDRAIVRQATVSSTGVITVDIPNSLLQKPYNITTHICIYEDDTFKTLYTIIIPVEPRKKPGDYTIEDTDGEIYSFNKLENMFNPAYERYIEINGLYIETVANVGTCAENAEIAKTSAETAVNAMNEAKKHAEASAVIDTVVFSNAEEAEALPSPSFASYVNWNESMTEDDAINLAGILTMDVGDILTMASGYYKTQIASVGGQLSGLMVRNIDVEGNVVYPWEWINPPMKQDVEYRTTERFNGKPVYRQCVKLVWDDFWGTFTGELTTNSDVNIIDVHGVASNGFYARGDKIGTSNKAITVRYNADNKPDYYIVDVKYIKDE